MYRVLQKVLNTLTGGKVWVEKAAPSDQIEAFLQEVKAIPVKCDLVRVGGAGDGGYLLPDDLEGLSVLVSPGVSTEVGFDLAMAARGLDVYMTDYSVDGPPCAHPRFHFQKKFLDVMEDAQSTRPDTLCAQIAPGHAGDRILQMDIEGAEYRVILDTSDTVLQSFRIMLIEFHGLDRLFCGFSSPLIQATFRKLLRTHDIVHIHPNNAARPRKRGQIVIPPVMEFTFLRRDRTIPDPDRRMQFPHPLDRDNVPDRAAVVLPECWR